MGIARNIARLVPNGSGLLPNANIEAVAASKLTGTVSNSQIADLAASKLTGQVPDANASPGSIIQALQATNNSTYTISGSGDFTNLAITITPIASSSRFLLIANLGQVAHSSGGSTIAFNFSRNGSSLNYISGGSYNGIVAFVNADTNAGLTTGPTLTLIDSPATTSAITYRVTYNMDGTKWVGRRPDGFIHASQQFQVLEIAG